MSKDNNFADDAKAQAASIDPENIVGNTSITPETWNSKYPLSDLPVNKFWVNTYYNDEGSATTCIGFARMVLDATYGRGTMIPAGTTFANKEAIKTAFNSISKGDRVTFATRNVPNVSQHAIIVAAKSTTGITMYDCNRIADHKIGYEARTWQQLFDSYSSILGGVHHA